MLGEQVSFKRDLSEVSHGRRWSEIGGLDRVFIESRTAVRRVVRELPVLRVGVLVRRNSWVLPDRSSAGRGGSRCCDGARGLARRFGNGKWPGSRSTYQRRRRGRS